MGVVIIVRGLNREQKEQKVVSHLSVLGVVGGFFERSGAAVGGQSLPAR
jgi:hypothetical protein